MSPAAKTFLARWVITTISVLVAANVVNGIRYDNWTGLLVATLLLGFLNAFVRPFMMLLSLPLLIFTLGLFMVVINAVLLFLVSKLVKSFHVDTFGAACWGALVVGIVSIVLNIITGTGKASVQVKTGQKPPDKPDSSSGPMIDV